MIWLLLGALIPSLAVSLAAGYAIRRLAGPLGMLDRPGEHRSHARATPTAGGLAIWLGIVLPLAAGGIALWLQQSGRVDLMGAVQERAPALYEFAAPHLDGLAAQFGRLWYMLAGATALVILGLVDDRRGVDYRWRLGIQTLIAIGMVAGGWRLSLFIDAPLVTGAVTVVWFVGLINSFNMLDNMDGLSGGVATIAASMLAAVLLLAGDPATHQPQLFIAGLLLVFVGSIVGFLWHNYPPARLFMGDTGSYLIGFLLAATTVMATFAGGDTPRHAILAPLCVLAVPIYDTLSVVLIRLRQRRSPFVGDQSHFSHRLMGLGLSKVQALWTIYLATATTGLGALLLHQVNAIGAAVILLMVACVLSLIGILEATSHRRIAGRAADERSPTTVQERGAAGTTVGGKP